jgi:hypothetical protein
LRFETTETGTETSFGTIRNKTFVSVVSLLYRPETFDVLIEPKQTEVQPKQFDREHILLFFTKKLGFFRVFFCFFRFFVFFVFLVFFGLFQNSLFRLFRFYTETGSFDVSIELKQTKDPSKQFKREYIWEFFRKIWVVSVCFGLFETPKQTEIFCFWFHETNRNKRKTDLVLICFGWNRNLFLFVTRTPYPCGFHALFLWPKRNINAPQSC